MNKAILLCLAVLPLAGCLDLDDIHDDCWKDATPRSGEPVPEPSAIDLDAGTHLYRDAGFDGTTWPDLSGKSLTIIDHGAFDYAFGPAKEAFEALTGATVVNIAADDAGSALRLAAQDIQAGGGTFDVIYGVDNALMSKAMDNGIFDPYTPLGASTIGADYRFAPLIDGAWAATPVDMGYIAINVDPRSGITIDDLDDLVTHADEFVTQDPRFSSPGLGFLVSTVATYGEDCYLGYWEALLDADATVTQGWTEAYVDRFSGGYGQWEDGSKSDKAIVTSYTTSPAYEAFYGGDLNDVLTASQATFQQIQTMGILKGTDNRIVAEAWIEFTLTDAFQDLAAEYNAIYPVVDADRQSVADVYAGNDPSPTTLNPAAFTAAELARVDIWVQDWADLFELKSL